MSRFLNVRDGGKTDEEGANRVIRKLLENAGIFASSDLLVSERGSGANASVDVSAGDIFIEYGDYGYHCWSTAVENLTVTANSSGNPRIDTVVAYVDLSVVSSASSNNPNAFKLAVVAGTAASSPSAPSDGDIQTAISGSNPFRRLANIAVADGFTSISDANVTDLREVIQLIGSDSWRSYTTVVPTRSGSTGPAYELTFAGVDLTSFLYQGVKVGWIQNGITRYGKVLKSSVSGSDTLVRVLTRCDDADADYDILDTSTYSISGFKYSTEDAPIGFPKADKYWTISVTTAVNETIPSTIGQIGSLEIDIPLGEWKLSFAGEVFLNTTGTSFIASEYGLSSSTGSFSDDDLQARTGIGDSGSGTKSITKGFYIEKDITLASDDTYYAIGVYNGGGSSTLQGQSNQLTVIKAVCMV